MNVMVKQRHPNALKSVYDRIGEKTKREVAVGFPAGKSQDYPDGTSVAEVASRHVYGIGVPVRDFMGLAKDEITIKTAPIIKKILKAEDPEPLLEAAGMLAQAAVQKAIVDLDDPPNSEETKAAKGSENPLIDTSHMLQSVTYVVRNKTR